VTFFFASMLWWVVGVVMELWHSPIRSTTTWAVTTTAAIAVGVAGAIGWSWWTRQPGIYTRLGQRFLAISSLVLIIAMVTTPPFRPATNAYHVATAWYQITAFGGAAILAARTLWRGRRAVQKVSDLPPDG
jgi:hypothetical protein